MFQTKLLIAALAFGGTQAVSVQADATIDDSCRQICMEYYAHNFNHCYEFHCRGSSLAQIEADDWFGDSGEDSGEDPDGRDLAQISWGSR